MNKTPYWMPEFEQILLKVASNSLPLGYIDILNIFCQKFEEKKEYKVVKYNCDALISAIYHYNSLYEKSFEIDLRLIKDNPPNTTGYWAIISRVVEISEYLGRTNEIMPYVVAFLSTPSDNVINKRSVLAWYARMFSNKENTFFNAYEHIVQKMENYIGKKTIPTLPFSKRVNFLNDEILRAK